MRIGVTSSIYHYGADLHDLNKTRGLGLLGGQEHTTHAASRNRGRRSTLRLYALLVVLGYSSRLWLRFIPRHDMPRATSAVCVRGVAELEARPLGTARDIQHPIELIDPELQQAVLERDDTGNQGRVIRFVSFPHHCRKRRYQLVP